MYACTYERRAADIQLAGQGYKPINTEKNSGREIPATVCNYSLILHRLDTMNVVKSS